MNSLRSKRKELGLTQTQVAKACGVSRRTYQTYEENDIKNETYNDLYKQLSEMGVLDGTNYILSIKFIKKVCRDVFAKHPYVKCAYLYGSYARGEASGKSDVDILVVCPPMGLDFYGIASELEDALHKKVDLQTHRQMANNEQFIENLLSEGVKVYEQKGRISEN